MMKQAEDDSNSQKDLGWDNPSYEIDKDLTKLTNEALPSPDNFKESIEKKEDEGHSSLRPTLSELMAGKTVERRTANDEVDTRKGKVIRFGWMEGVLLRCLLNIWGTMLFLRLTWVVGQAGIWQGLMVITLCNLVTWLSALSLSAISSNGQISGGGVYYVISRTLGPAIGGSIGIMFTIANTISVGTYVVGFAESLSDLLFETVPGYNGIIEHHHDDDIRIIGSVTLTCFLLLTIAGMDWVTRVQKFLLIILIFAQADMFIGSVLDLESGTWYVEKTPEGNVQQLSQDQRHAYGFTGWSMETTKNNLNPNWIDSKLQTNPDFFVTFGVFFTAVTGIVAGANLSGDLKDPSSAIPKGTLLSIIITYISYGYFALQTGCVFSNRASGIAEEYRSFQNKSIFRNASGYILKDPLYLNGTLHDNLAKQFIELPLLTDCSDSSNLYRDYLKTKVLNMTFLQENKLSLAANITKNIYDKWNTDGDSHGNCTYGSGQNQLTMTYITFTGWLSYAGCWAASLSSGIASIVGAPRILQAVGKDNIYPGIHFFEKGYNANNDPFRGYFLIYGASMGFVMLADLNAIGILASNFFLASYALMNLSCFHSEFTKSPSWRPAFKYYNKWVSLASAALCVGLMFGMAWIYATVTVVCQLILGAYIYYRAPAINWGSSTVSYTFNSALTSAREVTNTPDHIKTYRPKLLVLTGDPRSRSALVDFASYITRDISLLIFGNIMQKDVFTPSDMIKHKEDVQEWLKLNKISGFYTVSVSDNLRDGAWNCMTMSGLGKVSPNMILIGFKNNWKEDLESLDDYIEIFLSAFDLTFSSAIVRKRNGFDNSHSLKITDKSESNNNNDNETNDKSPAEIEEGNVDKNKITFQEFPDVKKQDGNIDVWWLFDDGGLSLLIPHLVSLHKRYKDCNLRVFFLSKTGNNLDEERKNLTDMLSRFRINYSLVTVIPLQMLTWEPDNVTKEAFNKMIDGCGVSDEEISTEEDKTNSFLRLSEILQHYSLSSELVMITLPLPRRSGTSPALYMAWLDSISRNLPTTMFIRGNQQSVLTFYS